MSVLSQLIRSASPLFIISMAGNITNYLFQFLMSRWLSTEDFGALNSLMALLVIFLVPSGALMAVMARYTSVLKAKEAYRGVRLFHLRATRAVGGGGLVLFFIFGLGMPWLSGFLRINAYLPFAFMGLTFFVGYLFNVNLGVFQGLQRFGWLGVNLAGAGAFRLGAGALLVGLGFGLNGATGGVLASTLIVFVLGFFFIQLSLRDAEGPAQTFSSRELLSYSYTALICLLCFTLLTNADMILVKHFLTPEIAGYYGGLAVLGRIPLYFPLAIAQVILPLAAESHALHRSTGAYLRKGALLTAALTAPGVALYFLFPGFVLGVLLGGKFTAVASDLWLIGLAMSLFAQVFLCISYHLARRAGWSLCALLFGAVLFEVGGIALFHETIRQVMLVLVTTAVLSLIGLWVVTISSAEEEPEEAEASEERPPLRQPVSAVPEEPEPASPEQKVSVIIPVKRVNAYLREGLERVRELEYPDFEVIVLPDEEGETLDGVRVIPSGPVGPAVKRNLGARHARGEVLAFLDDDAYPSPRWLERAIRHFRDPMVAAVGGPAVTPERDNTLQKASGEVYASVLGGGKARHRYVPGGLHFDDDLPSVNFLVRKDVFDMAGGFDSRYWPGEDTVFCHRVTQELGKRILYDPEVLVWHHRRELFVPHLRQVFNYALHRGFFTKAFPATSRRVAYFLPSAGLLGFALGLGLAAVLPKLRVTLLVPFGVYIVSLLYTAVAVGLRRRHGTLGLLMLLGIPLTHAAYGLGFIKGLLSRRLGEDVHAPKG